MKKIPIHLPTNEELAEIIENIDKILLGKNQNKDTNLEEKEIDRLVYQLYELTEEEIKIVEG